MTGVQTCALPILFSLVAVVLTAIGIKLEVIGNAWILAGDQTVAVLADELHMSFSTFKVIFDVFLVVITAAFSWVCFHLLTGNGTTMVIREGTLILAILTGICMKATDPLVDRLFKRVDFSD